MMNWFYFNKYIFDFRYVTTTRWNRNWREGK
jgi:hypothetical protein